MSDHDIEKEIQAKGLTAPRITPADIEANIASESYFSAADGVKGASVGMPGENLLPEYVTYEGSPLSLLTFCVLVLRNGFTVTGESACASPENFNAEIGRKVARDNAIAKMWPLMGYELKCRLAAEPASHQDRVRAECAELNGKLERLEAFAKTEGWLGLAPEQRALLLDQQKAMLAYRRVLHARIETFGEPA